MLGCPASAKRHEAACGARSQKTVIDDRIKLPLSQQWKDASTFKVTVRDDQVVLETVGPRLVAISRPPTRLRCNALRARSGESAA